MARSWAKPGLALGTYLVASRALPLLAPAVLRRRLARGKEDPARWREKLGEPTAPRPQGRLIWLHAVGLGEVLALRGLIAEMTRQADVFGLGTTEFLVTSTARSSGHVMGANLPPRTRHQFLPLDAPAYLERFLDYWRPDLSIWAEQEIWPGAILAADRRGIPLAMVNARITAASHARRRRLRALYADVLARLSLIAAQEEGSAARLTDLGATGVKVTGSLKSAAPPLVADPAELARLRVHLADRRVWVAASTHAGDEAEVMVALPLTSGALTIIAPRDLTRANAVSATLTARGLAHARRSLGELPGADVPVWLADSYGELGLWYRLAGAALIGGGFDRIGGHNPWEAAALGLPILHGPDTANFEADYAALDAAGAALPVQPGELFNALTRPDLATLGARAKAISDRAQGSLAPLARDLLALLRVPE